MKKKSHGQKKLRLEENPEIERNEKEFKISSISDLMVFDRK